ncbi:MAG TPA: GTPase HflX [Lachnospiraceae bacterium]|nr:GTPase HflX [Lachnospiraceae bacterium]
MEERERAVLVGADIGEDENFQRSMDELGELAKACGMTVEGNVVQKMGGISKAFCIGSGKVQEVKEYAKALEADVIIFDNSLTPSQMRNLQKETGKPVMDRTGLILDIFSTRAKTREAKLQVEAARLKYFMSRLVGLHDVMTRQGGASGSMSNKGAGEKKLELDRRKIEKRLAQLNKELEEVAKERRNQGKRRAESRIPKVALVGYTNAGKSSLMNAMIERFTPDEKETEKKVLEQDMLFATLDTAVRNIRLVDNREILLSDTVGFIHKLPHELVKAFRSTLEEVKNADLLLYVIDYSDTEYRHQIKVTEKTLLEIGAADIPVIYVYNKADLCDMEKIPKVMGERIYMSAKTGQGTAELAQMIQNKVYTEYIHAEFLFPYHCGEAAAYFRKNAQVLEQEYLENGIRLKVNCHSADAGKYEKFLL